MKVDRQDARFVNYLYTNDSSNDALLVEIKTPGTPLLGRKYRKGVHSPSSGIAGSVAQVFDYRRELSKNFRSITDDTNHKIEVFNPRCVVIAGNASTELDSEIKRKSFELFRTNIGVTQLNEKSIIYKHLLKIFIAVSHLFSINACSTMFQLRKSY